MKNHKSKLLFWDILLLVILVWVDQFTKHLAVLRLKNQPSVSVIPGILELSYLENHGAAFGILQNQKGFFVFTSVTFLCVIVYVLCKAPCASKYTRLHILLIITASGAIGNLADRLRLDYVVDFIYISLINFPIFNVADMYVTFSAAILVFQVLFVYQENDFGFLSFRQKKSGI